VPAGAFRDGPRVDRRVWRLATLSANLWTTIDCDLVHFVAPLLGTKTTGAAFSVALNGGHRQRMIAAAG
jgi:hypothetical protein